MRVISQHHHIHIHRSGDFFAAAIFLKISLYLPVKSSFIILINPPSCFSNPGVFTSWQIFLKIVLSSSWGAVYPCKILVKFARCKSGVLRAVCGGPVKPVKPPLVDIIMKTVTGVFAVIFQIWSLYNSTEYFDVVFKHNFLQF